MNEVNPNVVEPGAEGSWGSQARPSLFTGGMKMLRLTACYAVLALVLVGCADPVVDSGPRQDLSEVESIRIDYEHSGWGFEREGFILMPSNDGSDYLLMESVEGSKDPRDTGLRVSRHAVENLVAAASDPAWPREKGVRAVASRIKRDGVIAIEPHASVPPGPCTPAQLKRLARAYVRRHGVAALVDGHYGDGNSWTDDYPRAQVQILFRDGLPLRVYSNSQKLMMLPWYRGTPVNSPPTSGQNWSLALSRALREVLPRDSSFHERLGGNQQLGFLMLELEYRAREECGAMVRAGSPGVR